MKKNNSNIVLIVLILFILFIIIFPFIMINSMSNEWPNFFGSYVGSIIGAIATLLAVLYSFYLSNKNQKETEKQENSLIVYYDLVLGLTDLKKLYISLHNALYENIPTKMFFSKDWIKNVVKVSASEIDTEEIYKLYGDLESINSQLVLKSQITGMEPTLVSDLYSEKVLNDKVAAVSNSMFSKKFLTSLMTDYTNESDVSLDIDNNLNEDIKLIIKNLKYVKEEYNN